MVARPERSRVRLVVNVAVSAAIAAAFLLAGSRLVGERGMEDEPSIRSNLRSGEQLAVVLIASSSCPGIEDPRLETAIHDIQDYVAQVAMPESDAEVVRVGVATDASPIAGLELLERFGPFDEVHAGMSYLNSAAQAYLKDLPGVFAVPQVVIVRRTVAVRGGMMDVEKAEVLLRRIGAESMVELATMLKGRLS